jgi:hypothetical protein
VLQDFVALRGQKKEAAAVRLKPAGDQSTVATIAEAFAVAQKAATVNTVMPNV